MALPDPARILEDLNQKQKYNYLYIPISKQLDHIRIGIARSNRESALPHPQHQITGSLDELHILYLAIESYLRIEEILPSTLGVFRMSDKYDIKLYQVSATTTAQKDFWSHFDRGLDGGARDNSRNGNEAKAYLQEKSKEIQKIVQNKMNRKYEYRAVLTPNIIMHVAVAQMEGEKIRVQTAYNNTNEKQKPESSTDVYYTRRELTSLRFALLDFLRYQLRASDKIEMVRCDSRPKKSAMIDSKIQRHLHPPEVLVETP